MPALDATTTVAEPRTLAEARDAVAGGAALLFRGGGTKLDWGPPPERLDTVVSTARLDRLLSHDPGDMTASAQAGIPLARLQERLAEHGQWLAVDPPLAGEGATLGGVLATADAGPRRQRFGTLRDLVIGATAVLPDGSISRSGGRVIKNVAGYDLAKLWAGSFGSLGLVVEVTVRLHPLPPTTATLRVPAGVQDATAVALAVLAAPLEPVALDWEGRMGDGAEPGTLLVAFQGRAEAVDAQVERTAGLVREHALAGAERLDGDAEQRVWAGYRDGLAGASGETIVRAVTRPSELADAGASLARAADAADVDATLRSHAGLGIHTAALAGGDAAAHAAVVGAWRLDLAALGGHAVVRRRVDGLDRRIDLWGPEPPGFALMRRVKAELDPEGRCAPGRFVGGL